MNPLSSATIAHLKAALESVFNLQGLSSDFGPLQEISDEQKSLLSASLAELGWKLGYLSADGTTLTLVIPEYDLVIRADYADKWYFYIVL